MKKIEIKNRWTGAVLYATEVDDADLFPLRTAVQRANLARADLAGAYLAGANLAGADLAGADLAGAYLAGANLAGANLARADLAGAYLAGAYLADANLARADLTDANLARADLARADLAGIRDDFRGRLDLVPDEVAGLRAALVDGRIDGSCYEGQCACFVGTIAKIRAVNYKHLGALKPDSSSATENWFLALRPGHTPENHPVAAITIDWIDEWSAERGVGPLIEEAAL